MKRFYASATVSDANGILLDGRPVKTPRKALLIAPTAALAAAIAEEWQAQGDTIRPATMILTKLANTAIDRVAPQRAKIEAEVLDYAGSDLVCYRAESPADLAARQAAHWDPVIAFARSALDAAFFPVTGLMHRPQPQTTLAAFSKAIAREHDWSLTAIHNLATLTGSALLALMLCRNAITEAEAWSAAHVDEDYQIEHWGEDGEARDRRTARHAEFLACCRFMRLATIPTA